MREGHQLGVINFGELAQLARAFAWHAKGQGFDSPVLHSVNPVLKRGFLLYHLYILYSRAIDQYYIGHTQDLKERLYRHNNSGSLATKKANGWIIVYTESLLQNRKQLNEK
jgi:hypothetical protein